MSMRWVDCKRWGMLCLKSLPAPLYDVVVTSILMESIISVGVLWLGRLILLSVEQSYTVESSPIYADVVY